MTTHYPHPQQIDASIFRAYDIRGLVPEALNPPMAYAIGCQLAAKSLTSQLQHWVVGYDGRLSSPELHQALVDGLMAGGCDVTSIGMSSSPMLYFAIQHYEKCCGVMVTGSHNPKDHNGLKIIFDHQNLTEDDVKDLHRNIMQGPLPAHHRAGHYDERTIREAYLEAITSRIHIQRPLKVVIDAGNGAASLVARALFEALGVTVIPLFCEIDGRFPNHHPDPSRPENCQHAIEAVRTHQADLGLLFDGDADRLGVVTAQGRIIWPDRQLMAFSQSVLAEHPGAQIVFDIKCSQQLGTYIQSQGGQPVMWKTGHSLIKQQMIACQSPLSGEMSGHIFFKDRWFGFDDGVYAGARLLELLSRQALDSDAFFEQFPDSVNTPEMMIPVSDADKFKQVAALVALAESSYGREAELIVIDGLRIAWPEGWALIRASNTTPNLTLRFEAEHPQALETIYQRAQSLLKQVGLEAPPLA